MAGLLSILNHDEGTIEWSDVEDSSLWRTQCEDYEDIQSRPPVGTSARLYSILMRDKKMLEWQVNINFAEWEDDCEGYEKTERMMHKEEILKAKNQTEELSDEEEAKEFQALQKVSNLRQTALKQTRKNLRFSSKKPKAKKRKRGADAIEQVDANFPSTIPLPSQWIYVANMDKETAGFKEKVFADLSQSFTEYAPQEYSILLDTVIEIAPPMPDIPRDEFRGKKFAELIPHTRAWEESMLHTKLHPWERDCINDRQCIAVLSGSPMACVEYLEPDEFLRAKKGHPLPPVRGRCLQCLRYFYQYMIVNVQAEGADIGNTTLCPFYNLVSEGEYVLAQCNMTGKSDWDANPVPVVAQLPCYEMKNIRGVIWFLQTYYLKPEEAPNCMPFFA